MAERQQLRLQVIGLIRAGHSASSAARTIGVPLATAKRSICSTMNRDFFAAEDSVLLVGEGNFSFAVDLVNLNLPIKITATCFETEFVFDSGKENSSYLKQKDVRVLLGVDGTKLAEHPILGKEKFSKILFNFPHVGGKMKIHLNRKLLRHFFKSATECIAHDGQVLVSLCKGQGGTSFDHSLRRWDDTWQIVEMAAYGDFVLVAVEPFRTNILQKYASVGYRGGSSAFHTNGALVHVFCKRQPLFEDENTDALPEFHVLNSKDGEIHLAHVHHMKCINNPFMRSDSVVSYFCEQLMMSLAGKHHTRQLDADEAPLSSVDDMNQMVFEFVRRRLNEHTDNLLLCPELALRGLGSDFSLPPVSCLIFLSGCDMDLCEVVQNYLNNLLLIFGKDTAAVIAKHIKCEPHSERETVIEKKQVFFINDITVGHMYCITIDDQASSLCIIQPEELAKLLFGINWREVWSEHSYVIKNCKVPVFKRASLEAGSYSLDISFSENSNFSEERFYNVLWNYACDVITEVKLLNVYNSIQGWISRCYRITYKSFDKALNRDKAVYIQQNILGKILSTKLGVTIR